MDRFSALAILVALVGTVVVSEVDFGYRHAVRSAPSSATAIGGAVVASAGLALRLWSSRTLGQFFTSTVQVVPDRPVIEHGPCRVLRHPSHTGALLTVLGVAMAFGSVIGVVATLALGIPAYAYRTAVEERVVLAELGDAYRSYRTRTWRLVPFAY